MLNVIKPNRSPFCVASLGHQVVHNAHTEHKASEAKFRQAENEKIKMEEKGSHKKSKTVDKQFEKVTH